MLVTKMDLLNYQYMDKMNNNIGILCYEGEAALGVDPRMHQSMSLSSSGVTNHSHRTGPPPINPGKRKLSLSTGQGQQDDDEQDCDNQHMTKMNRLVTAQLGQPSNGDFRSTKDPRDRSRSPIERAAAPSMVLHGNYLYAPHHHMPSLAMVQPLALTKNNMDAARTLVMSPTVSPVARQQNRPSVITCARANTLPSNYIRRPASSSNTACVDPVIEEHFRRSLGRNYKQPEPITNSVSITGTVDDHFTKALGETWLQIKAKGSSSSSPDSSPNSHMINHSHSPSVLS